MAGKLALSVSQLNEYVRRLFQQDPLLHDVSLKGEISNLKFHQTGTLFFTLKDELAAISCVMYAQDVCSLQMEPYDGMRVVVSGSVGLYAKSGQYQFYAKEIHAQGLGVLYERYQMLREKLEREGLFAPERKRMIPAFVDTVGVVSSPTGAVIHDILSVSLRRDSEARILLCPVRVQGTEAADEVVEAIHLLEQLDHVSVIVLARGGGSIEDLWTFNEERVVRAVAACRKPIVSAIGHETDYTLCDFAADLRAPTPSAAAECVVPVREAWENRLAELKRELSRYVQMRLDQSAVRLSMQKQALSLLHPRRQVDDAAARLIACMQLLRRAMENRLTQAEQQVKTNALALELLSPYAVLSRGYAVVRCKGALVTSAAYVQPGDMIDIALHDGQLAADVKRIENRPSVENGVKGCGDQKETESLF